VSRVGRNQLSKPKGGYDNLKNPECNLIYEAWLSAAGVE
jgi:hypothetical protein